MTNHKHTRLRSLALATLVTILFAGSAALASEEASEGRETHGEASEDHEAHDSHGYHPHHIALFAGITSVGNLDEETFGLDYEFRFHKNWGVGALADHPGGKIDAWIYAPVLFIHPVGGLTFTVAPGVEHARGRDQFLVRLGIGYSFHVGERASIFPSYNVDFVNGATIDVYGVAIGFGF